MLAARSPRAGGAPSGAVPSRRACRLIQDVRGGSRSAGRSPPRSFEALGGAGCGGGRDLGDLGDLGFGKPCGWPGKV